MTPRRIVLATVGSLGDLHPYIAIARGLQERGHHPIVASMSIHRERVESAGVRFAPVRPDLSHLMEGSTRNMARYMDRDRGPERVLRELCMPGIEDSHADLLEIARGADVIVSHPLTFTVPMVAGTLGIAWASSVLAPLSFFSAIDPPVLPGLEWAESLRGLAPGPQRLMFALAARLTAPWVRPVADLRARLGFPPGAHPLFAGQHSPQRVLGLFSSVLAEPRADWPARTLITGFPFLDRPEADALPVGLREFLEAGDAPLVFTLGTSAVFDAGEFYAHSVAHAEALGRRAVLLTGVGLDHGVTTGLPGTVFAVDYAPYASLFPRAAAIVHQGGVGTTGEALRAGRPMLVLPFSHDQFDNAARIRRLGVGLTGDRRRYGGAWGRRAIAWLLTDRALAERAERVGARVRAEAGVARACEALEALAGGG